MNRELVAPVSPQNDWTTLLSAPATRDAGSDGAAITAPLALAIATHPRLAIDGRGTIAQVRLAYPAAASISTAPKVELFGLDSQLSPERLLDSASATQATLSADAGDVSDGTLKYTTAVEMDCNGASSLVAGVSTALAGTSIAGAVVQVRLK